MPKEFIQGRAVVGRMTVGHVVNGVWRPLACQPNQIQDSWGFIAAQAIGKGLRAYRIQAMYLEFENVADPDDPVTVPDYTQADGLEYYNDLINSDTRDYLRVPLLTEPLLGVESGYEDQFEAGVDGNLLTFFTISQGVTGVHGKDFSDSVNSKVCGAALIATPDFGDPTLDVIFARSYLDAADQVPKLPSSQIGVTWETAFLSVT